MDVNFLLDSAKTACGVEFDKDLAPRLGVGKTSISNYRKGVSLPDPVVCATLAGLTGMPLAQVLGIVGEARAISSAEKAVWRRLAATATLLVVALLGSAQQPVQAASTDRSAQPEVYIMRSAGEACRWLWHLFTTWARSKRKPRGPHLSARIAA